MPENSSKTTDRQYYLFALRIAGDFGATIGVPVVFFVMVGRWLDGRYATGLLFTVMGFVVSALISGRIIYKKSKQYGREYQDMVNKKQ